MEMISPLYDKKVNCPVCQNTFVQQAVRSRHVRIVKRESDFCVHYAGEDPLFYGIHVCQNCGYAMPVKEFKQITDIQKVAIRAGITPKWKKQDFSTKRTIDDAMAVHKLALIEAEMLKKSKTVQGMLSLKIAWLYRKQQKPEEQRFMQNASTLLSQAYQEDSFRDDTFTQEHCAYLVGEINRRLENYSESIKWFDTALKNRSDLPPSLKKMIREQWQEASAASKELRNKEKEAS